MSKKIQQFPFCRLPGSYKHAIYFALLALFVGCATNRVPRLLSNAEQVQSKPDIIQFLNDNSESLAEQLPIVTPITTIEARQTDEILPYECWDLALPNKSGHATPLLWKIYSIDADASTERAVIFNRLATTTIPIAIPVVWAKAKPYTRVSSVLFARPRGQSIAKAIANKIHHGKPIDGTEYNDLMKQLVDLHKLYKSDSVNTFTVNEWLRQMAEIGEYRKLWGKATRENLLDIAKGWHPARTVTLHGDLTGQNVWVDTTFKVTAMMNWEKLGTGDPTVDLGYLLADATIIQPFEMNERYNQMLPEGFQAVEIGKTILKSYRIAVEKANNDEAGSISTNYDAQFLSNLRAAFYLRLITTYLYQQNDPLLQIGLERIHRLIPKLIASDPVGQMVK